MDASQIELVKSNIQEQLESSLTNLLQVAPPLYIDNDNNGKAVINLNSNVKGNPLDNFIGSASNMREQMNLIHTQVSNQSISTEEDKCSVTDALNRFHIGVKKALGLTTSVTTSELNHWIGVNQPIQQHFDELSNDVRATR